MMRLAFVLREVDMQKTEWFARLAAVIKTHLPNAEWLEGQGDQLSPQRLMFGSSFLVFTPTHKGIESITLTHPTVQKATVIELKPDTVPSSDQQKTIEDFLATYG